MLRRHLLVAALAAAILTSGIGVGSATGLHGRPPSGAAHTILSDRIPLSSPSQARPLPSSEPVRLSFTLEPSHGQQLLAFDRDVGNPGSPLYRQFLTEPQFESRFSPAVANVTAVLAYLDSVGARDVSVSPDRMGITFVLPAGAAAHELGTTLVELRSSEGGVVRTTTQGPSLPPGIAERIAAVGGLGGTETAGTVPLGARGGLAPWAQPRAIGEFLNGTGIAAGRQWFVGSDVANAYREVPLFPGTGSSVANATYPTGEAVATLLMSSYNDTTHQDLPPWDPTQIDTYFNETLGPGWPRPVVEGVPVAIDNVTPPAPGSLGFLNDTTLNEEENSLDLEMAGSTAPGARLVNFYFAASLFVNASSSTTYGTIADDFALTLASALAHNYSPGRLAAVSGSFGLPDLNDSLWNTELAHAAAIGVTVVASSGDQGNAPDVRSGRNDGPWPTWPASAAFATSGAIAVGGTTMVLAGSATGTFDGKASPSLSYDGSISGLAGQSAWYDAPSGANVSGTEGGISLEFPEPAWQFGSAAQPPISSAAGSEGVVALGRAEPDIAFPADGVLALVATHPGPSIEFAVLEGTSISAPLFAGLIAEWAAVARHPFGFLDPELYRIASYFEAHPGADDPFLDVTAGQNYAFAAASGWDATTGWGGIDGVRFLTADAKPAIRDYVYTGPTPGLPPRPSDQVPTGLLVAIPLGVTIAGVVVIWIALERRTAARVAGGRAAFVPPPNAPEGSWFVCPYCGAARPSEPVRCPGCGRY